MKIYQLDGEETANELAILILVTARHNLYSDMNLTIRQMDMLARRLNNAIDYLRRTR